MFSVSKASHESKDSTFEDRLNVLKIFRYQKGNKNYGIKFPKNIILNVYTDVDYGEDKETRKSTPGYLFMIGNGSTSWYSKLQCCVAVFKVSENEYYNNDECSRCC